MPKIKLLIDHVDYDEQYRSGSIVEVDSVDYDWLINFGFGVAVPEPPQPKKPEPTSSSTQED